jgi:multicomponent K+:H+ antiporter subunit A
LALVGVAGTAVVLVVCARGLPIAPAAIAGLDPAFGLIWVIGIACALGAATVAKFHRLAALVLVGGAGVVTCITFVWLSAPDLALTQLVVEVVTTVLLLLGLRWLPKRLEGIAERTTFVARARRTRDIAVAAGVGAGLSVLAYAVMTRPLPRTISEHFLARAYTEGGGTNVVNVILVDFRGFDTLGEITVLGVVAVTVFALLRRFRPAADSIDVPEQQRLQNDRDAADPKREIGDTAASYLAIPRVIIKLLFPFIVMVAVYLLLRGHDLPGGGFVAGVAFAAGLILQFMAGGIRWTEDHIRILPLRWIAAGLLLALGTGASAWLFGRPFLTTYFAYADLPVLGSIPLATALAFDVGVFSLVVGATALMLVALARQSIRAHRSPPSGGPAVAGE